MNNAILEGMAKLIEAQSMTPAQCRRKVRAKAISVSYHESGHHIIGAALGLPVTCITLDLRAALRSGPRCLGGFTPSPELLARHGDKIKAIGKSRIEAAGLNIDPTYFSGAVMVWSAAGCAAECARLGIPFGPQNFGGTDRTDVPDEVVGGVCNLAAEMVRENWDAIQTLARALLAKIETADGPIVEMGREETE